MHKRILIIDDSQSAVRMIQDVLNEAGYTSIGLNDPMQIEKTIEVESPCLILLDVVMPERNGFQVCRELKGHATYGKIPVILVTSMNTTSDGIWAQQQGADGYVAKPFTKEDLLNAVRRFA